MTPQPSKIKQEEEEPCATDHIVITIENCDDANTSKSTSATTFTAPTMTRHIISMDEGSPLMNHHSPQKEKSSPSLWIGVWYWYTDKIHHHPVMTKCLTATVLVGAGDLAAQALQATGTFDVKRYLRFCCLGCFVQAPVTHYYYLLLDAKLPPTPYPWTLTTLVKLIIDQLIFAPCFTVLTFAFLDTLVGVNLLQHLREAYLVTLIENWKLWVPATLINIAYCPPEFRVLFSNAVFFVWSIVLSILFDAQNSGNGEAVQP
jgi:hypothetical protein